MQKPHVKASVYLLLAVLSVVGSVLNLYLVKILDIFGSPAFFALGLLVQVHLLATFIYSSIVGLKRPLQIVWSLIVSAGQGMRTNKSVVQLEKRHRSATTWLMHRFELDSPTGLVLTIGVAAAALWLIGFLGVAEDIWFKDSLTQIDVRVLNLTPSIRTPLQTNFFQFVTFLANWQSMVLMLSLTSWLFWARKQRLMAALFPVVFGAEELIASLIKHLIRRPRPPQYLSVIRETTYSFPSGHALRAALLMGLLAYLLFMAAKHSLTRLVIIYGALTAIFLVALSRVYLGAHYPSDVMASVLLGFGLLSLLITAIEISYRYQLWGQSKASVTNKQLVIAAPLMLVFALALSSKLVKLNSVQADVAVTAIPTINDQTIKQFSLYSETLSGARMEPISFVYIGSQSQIEAAFESHGWYKADSSTMANTLKAVSIGYRGQQYLNAPVTPSYLDARPQDVAFEEPTNANTLRQRHHTRLWRTKFILPDGRPVWVATASFDEGVQLAGPLRLPTHRINPQIDAERDYIASSLGFKDAPYLRVVDPQLGKNASGDPFFTDGRAVEIGLN